MKKVLVNAVKKTGKMLYGAHKGENYEMFMLYFSNGGKYGAGNGVRADIIRIFKSSKTDRPMFDLLNKLPRVTDGELESVKMDSEEYKKFLETDPHFEFWGTDMFTVDRVNKVVEYQDGCTRFMTRNVRIDGKPSTDPSEPKEFWLMDASGDHITRKDKAIKQTHVTVLWIEQYDEVASIEMGAPVWVATNGGSTPEEAIQIELDNQRDTRFIPVITTSLSEAVAAEGGAEGTDASGE